MNINQLLADSLERSLGVLQMTLGDFSDADMFVRPAPGANHAMWQLGHLVNSETRLVTMVKPGAMPELPAGFAERFSAETTKVDDPKAFPTKAEVLELLAKARAASVQWARGIKPEELDQPTPERIQRLAPTVGALAAVLPSHVAMHVGQMQVIRRKLGKPILF
ncbi:MAG TPA: DinB family protein [Tepidisphaeraceae bacterium]|jgi:hypothetical protein